MSTDDDRPSFARRRTLDHVKHLLATTAAGGSTLIGACQADGQGEPVVCDPMPPPVSCQVPNDAALEGLDPWATWKKTGETWDVVLKITVGYRAEDVLTLSGQPKVDGATIVSSDVQSTSATLTLRPVPGSKNVTVEIGTSCQGKTSTYKVQMDVSATADRKDGAMVPSTETAK